MTSNHLTELSADLPTGGEQTALLVGPPSETLARRLRAAGVRVLTSSTAEETLGLLMRHAIDCLVAHANLPGMSTAELLDEIRRRGDPPLLVVESRGSSPGEIARWLESGAADCVDAGASAEIVAARCAAIMRRRTRR